MDHQKSYPGGVFAATLPDGRGRASIVLGETAIIARVDEQDLILPYAETMVEMGGAGGRVLFLRKADRSLTIHSHDQQLLLDLQHVPDATCASRVEALLSSRRQRRARGKLVIGAVLAVLLLITWQVPAIFDAGILAAVDAVPVSVDEKIGKLAYGQMQGSLRVTKLPEVEAAMQEMLARLEAVLEGEEAEFDFRVDVVDSTDINAFALPGGQMVFFTGLIKQAESADEVAGVLAHEMGHVIRRHSMQRIGQSLGIIAGVQLLIGDYGGLIAVAAEALSYAAINSYSREAEAESDAIAVDLMHRAGLDPAAVADFFQRLEEHEEGSASEAIPDWMRSHPRHGERIEAVRRRAAKLTPRPRQPLNIDWPAVRAAVGADLAGGKESTDGAATQDARQSDSTPGGS